MSTALAIAAVTAVLKSTLNNSVIAAGLSGVVGSDVGVSSLPPDRISLTGSQDPNQLNLFLYQTSINTGWRNAYQPSRDAAGQRTSNPPLPLNLHYMLSAYGSQDYYAEIILGVAMQALHEASVLTRPAIRKALSPAVPPAGLPPQLAAAGLADQVEQITIVPEILSMEDIWRVWSALQARYRTTTAYQVTVVLVESTGSMRGPLPVTSTGLAPVPFAQIEIDQVITDKGPGTPILPTSTLIIQGKNLRALDTRLSIGPLEFPLTAAQLTATRITFPLPNPAPAGFYAGLKPLQVVQAISVGGAPHRLLRSDAFPIALRPAITATPSGIASTVVDGVTYHGGTMQVQFTPKVGRAQQVVLLLNEYNPPDTRPAYAYSFNAPLGNGIADPTVPDAAAINFPFTGVLPGAYIVRVQVDGAESVLGIAGGLFASPQVTI